jgi:hypothetical protein
MTPTRDQPTFNRKRLFPQQNLIVVFTGWDVPNEADITPVPRLLPAAKAAVCTGTPQGK